VGIYGGGGAPYNHARIFAEAGFDVSFVSAQAARERALRAYDVFVVPGGGRTANRGQLRLLGDDGADAVTDFVRGGGLYLGSCAGAHNVCVIPDDAKPKYGQRRMQLINVGMWHGEPTEWHFEEFPGVGVVRSRNLHPAHPVMAGVPERFAITHYNGPFFVAATGALTDASDALALAAVTGYTADFTPGEYAMALSRYDGRAPGSVVERAAAIGAANACAGSFGQGRVVVFGSHPEFGHTLEMDAYGIAARMLANAAFWQATFRGQGWASPDASVPGGEHVDAVDAVAAGLDDVTAALAATAAAGAALRRRLDGPSPSWLAEEHAMSTFGLTGEAIWKRSLEGLRIVEERVRAGIERLRALAAMLAARREAHADLAALAAAIRYAAPGEWQQDFGYQGLVRTVETCGGLLRQAAANYEVALEPSPDPYAHDDVSPYHLVAACYYGAFGVLQNAWLLVRAHERRLEDRAWLFDALGPASPRDARATVNRGGR
jgi:hypothetical protein